MKRSAYLLLLTATGLQAADVELDTITVESTRLSDVSGEQVKSADLADALIKNVPSASLVRRSGIANDIILRGQKKDNINILIDNAKIYGACPNRMDPPTSHVLTNNIEGIEITEGPYDVENFGTLSGAVKITTQKPADEFEGEVSLNLGSWDYRKLGTTISGGSDKVRFLVSASKENSEQYEDGDGNDFAQQMVASGVAAGPQYKTEYQDMDAYDKQTFMGKLYVDVAENQELMLSYTANRSDDVLYPSTMMDALYDDSDIINIDYSIKNMASWSKSLDIQVYKSTVEHPMSTFYRNASGAGSVDEMISHLETDMRGLKIKNSLDLDNDTTLSVGLDTSKRNWDGTYTKKGAMAGAITGIKSIDDVDTNNVAIFAEVEKRYANLNVKAGARYDDTSIKPQTGTQASRDFDGLGGFVFATYKANDSTKYFGGIGRASRVPDARELYFRNSMPTTIIGTPTLNETTNTEIDLGIEKRYQDLTMKAKVFYSWLDDYIHYNANNASNNFENVDATIYGMDISGSYFVTDDIYLDFGMAYQRGEKDNALTGQTDTDLAEITPLKANIALNYDYGTSNTARIELVAADDWSNFDSDNGEQRLGGYGVVNLKVKHNLSKQIEITAGMDNAFNKTYAVSNTYNDLSLLSSGGQVILMNEPGRYLYVNATYRF